MVLSHIMFEKLFGTDKQKDFWKWFTKNQQQLFYFESNQEILFDELSRRLKAIDENLVFEFSPVKENQIREFSISADGIKSSFPAVIALIEKAPDLMNWGFYAFRQAVPSDNIEISMDNGVVIGYSDIYFRYGEDEDSKIGLELHIKNANPESKAIKSAIFVLLDSLIGEYDAETRISWIDIVPLDEKDIDKLYPFVYLRDLVDLSKI